jgi:hypothetical protein
MFEDDDFLIGEKADKPLGYPPTGIYRRNLENLYISIVGALDVGDFTTFLKEVSDLTYSEAKDKLIATYGSPKQLSAAKMKAKSKDDEAKLAHAEQQSRDEQRSFETEFAELDEIARKRLAENLELIRKNEELEKEVKRLKTEIETKAFPTPAPTSPPTIQAKAPPPPSLPPQIPPSKVPEIKIKPTIPQTITPTPPREHGRLYDQLKIKINFSNSISELQRIAVDIYGILSRDEMEKLNDADISELLEDIGKARESIERRAAERAARPAPKITRIGAIQPKEGTAGRPKPEAPIREELGQFLFDFNQVPGRDTDRFIDLMKSKYKINWIRRDDVKKDPQNPNEIKVESSDKTHFVTLEFYKERFTAILRFDTKAVEFWAIPEDSHINIFTKRPISAVISRLRPPTGAGEARAPSPTTPQPPTARVAYRYHEPDINTLDYKGEEYIVDYELVRVIRKNGLLPDPPFGLKWFELPPELKRKLTGYDLGTAFRIQVNYRHEHSWYELINDYGIPQKYVLAWGGTID